MYREKVIVLEAKAEAGNYEGNAYYSIKVRTPDLAEGAILEFKVDLKKVNVADCVALLDKEANITLAFYSAQGKAVVKVCAVEPA